MVPDLLVIIIGYHIRDFSEYQIFSFCQYFSMLQYVIYIIPSSHSKYLPKYFLH